jgi:hypothetical protein
MDADFFRCSITLENVDVEPGLRDLDDVVFHVCIYLVLRVLMKE